MAQEEWTGSAMIIVDVKGRGVAVIDDDDECARYPTIDVLRASQPAGLARSAAESLRILVEAQRRFGGLAPRALVGGRFVPGGTETSFEVHAGAPLGQETGQTCPSRLWKRPFVAGLPAAFAGAVLQGVMADGAGPGLPPGILTVDRAGFDEVESAAPIFAQAGALLRQVLAATLAHRDIETEARLLMSTW